MGETPSLLSTTSPLHLSDTTFTPRASRASCECMVCSYILKLFWFLSRYRWALPLIPKSSKVISYNKIISSSQKASQWSVALSLLQQLQQQLLPSIVSCCAAVAACRVERSGWRRAAGMVLEIRKKTGGSERVPRRSRKWLDVSRICLCYTPNFGDERDARPICFREWEIAMKWDETICRAKSGWCSRTTGFWIVKVISLVMGMPPAMKRINRVIN